MSNAEMRAADWVALQPAAEGEFDCKINLRVRHKIKSFYDTQLLCYQLVTGDKVSNSCAFPFVKLDGQFCTLFFMGVGFLVWAVWASMEPVRSSFKGDNRNDRSQESIYRPCRIVGWQLVGSIGVGSTAFVHRKGAASYQVFQSRQGTHDV